MKLVENSRTKNSIDIQEIQKTAFSFSKQIELPAIGYLLEHLSYVWICDQ